MNHDLGMRESDGQARKTKGGLCAEEDRVLVGNGWSAVEREKSGAAPLEVTGTAKAEGSMFLTVTLRREIALA